jgi:carbamoyltransferase
MSLRILGLSAFYHDAAAALVVDGDIVAAAQEERFTRKKHDLRFPVNAIRYCLAEGGIAAGDLDAVVFYEEPRRKFGRLVTSMLATAPASWPVFRQAAGSWFGRRLWRRSDLADAFADAGLPVPVPRIHFLEHHYSHAASAFFPSPFERAAVLVMDGVGEWATTTIWRGEGGRLHKQAEICFPHSLGLLYSAFTAFTGFKVNSGEYKLMGLAPYGRPIYADRIRDHLLARRDDGSFALRMENFGYLTGMRMADAERFAALFDGPPRRPESPLTRREMDIAASIQVVTEEVVIGLVRQARDLTGEADLCLAGGVALNCVANGKILKHGLVERLWIQPAAGDAGGALGAALGHYHQTLGHARLARPGDAMQGGYLGPAFTDAEVEAMLARHGAAGHRFDDDQALADAVAGRLAEGDVIGLAHGRMEFGPRALGNRSIIGDPRRPDMQSTMNLKIKFRESFRPFAPSVLRGHVGDWFDLETDSPYMLLVGGVRPDHQIAVEPPGEGEQGIVSWINQTRSDIPAVTHVDYSARLHTVTDDTNPLFAGILRAFQARTGCPVLINTSFNVRSEPIVCSPEDAYRCFMRTGMDALVLNRTLLRKSEQPAWNEPADWIDAFELD